MLEDPSLSVLTRRKAQVLFSLLTRSDSLEATLFKARAVEILVSARALQPDGEGLNDEQIWLMVEESAGYFSRSQTWDLIKSMPLIEEIQAQPGYYRLRKEISLRQLQAGPQRPEPEQPSIGRWRRRGRLSASISSIDVVWTLDEVRAAFFPVVWPAWTIRGARNAILRGYTWLLWTLHYGLNPANDLSTMPAFWSCERLDGDRAEDIPVGNQRAVTSVGDALGSLVDSHYAILTMAATAGDHRAALDYGIAQLLGDALEENLTVGEDESTWRPNWGSQDDPPSDCPVWDERTREWNRGGFLPFDDQPEAIYPTVDGTWDAVLALSSLYDLYDQLTEAHGPLGTTRSELGSALLGGVAFLVRMQLGPSGGWGVYRYRNDTPPVPPQEFTTGQTILALHLALQTTAFEDLGAAPLRAEAEAALLRAWEFLQRTSQSYEDLRAWAPFFDTAFDMHRPQDVVRATVWTGTGLLALYRAFDDLRPAITPWLYDVVTLVDRHWQLNYERSADTFFRVPLEYGLHDTYGKWSNRYDVTVAILMLDLCNQSREDSELELSFSPELWSRLERTLGFMIQEQHPEHGHWGEPVAGLPLAAATAMAIQALQLYLVAAVHLATQRDVASPEV